MSENHSARIDHDRLFKQLLKTFFADFIDLFLPSVAAYIDRSSIEFLDPQLFFDITAGEKREVDLLAKVRLKGKDSCFLIHTEAQATREPEFSRRLFTYFARLHESFGLDVYPIALFSFDSPKKTQQNYYEVRFPDRRVLRFNYAVIQLNRLSWRKYARTPNPAAVALTAKMAIAPKDRPRVQLECLWSLVTLKLDPARQTLIAGFFFTYLNLTAKEMEVYNSLREKLGKLEQEAIMQVEAGWTTEVRKMGREEGREEGRKEGMVLLVTRQLNRRIGDLESRSLERVEKLTPEQLEALSEALFDFATAADLDRWLHTQGS